MKPKQLSKKLVLNKHSVTNLNNPEMNDVKGGVVVPPSTYTCFMCDSNISCPQEGGNCIMHAGYTSDCYTVHIEDNCVSNVVTYCNLPCRPLL